METFKKFEFKDFSITWIKDLKDDYNIEVNVIKKIFYKATPEMLEECNIKDTVKAVFSAYLIEKDGKKALIDTGSGNSPEAKGYLTERLIEMKINPEDIDYIFLTHSHWDHAGGYLKDGELYKNAKVYLSKPEFDGWKLEKEGAYKNTALSLFEKAKDHLTLFNYEEPLPLGLIAHDSHGHTPGHSVYQIENILFLGDVIHSMPLQLLHPEVSDIYDCDPETGIESRKRIIKYAKDNKLILLGNHFKSPYIDYRFAK